MPKRATIGCACLVVALMAGDLATQASAQTSDRRTFFTFSGPFQLPGKSLPAGKYIFRIPDPESRTVIQVLSEDGKKPVAMFFSMSVERVEAAHDAELRFFETAAGVPPAVKTIWFPGERSGLEFIYPREQALRLAKTATEPVLTTKANTTTTAETNTTETTRVTAKGEESEEAGKRAASAPTGRAQAGEAAPESIGVAPASVPRSTARSNQATTQVARVEQSEAARTRLPKTASLRPLVGLAGAGLLLAGTVLSLRRRTGV